MRTLGNSRFRCRLNTLDILCSEALGNSLPEGRNQFKLLSCRYCLLLEFHCLIPCKLQHLLLQHWVDLRVATFPDDTSGRLCWLIVSVKEPISRMSTTREGSQVMAEQIAEALPFTTFSAAVLLSQLRHLSWLLDDRHSSSPSTPFINAATSFWKYILLIVFIEFTDSGILSVKLVNC